MNTLSRRHITWCFTALLFACVASTSGCVCMVSIPVAPFKEPIPLPPAPPRQEPPIPKLESCLQLLSNVAHFGDVQLRCSTPRTKEVSLRHNAHPHCPEAIQITGLRIEAISGDGFSISDKRKLPITLRAGETTEIAVSYKARILLTTQANLVIATDHPEQSSLTTLLEAHGVNDVTQIESYTQQANKTDVLFIVDASRSMSQEQASLSRNFSSFMQWATQLNSDFQVGLIGIQVSDTSPACLVGTPKILDTKTPNLANAFATRLTQIGTHSGREMGLETAYRALSPPLINQPSCNKDFMRDKAVLSVVFVSDEPDQSDRTYAYYQNFFAQLKGQDAKHLVRISAVVGPSGGCSSSFGRAQAGPRYLNLAKEFNGISASICDSDWSKSLERIGLNSILNKLKFKLKTLPEEGSLQVKIDGKVIPESKLNGWEYLEDTNEVLFRGGHVPLPGQKIEFRYLTRCPEAP